jgi:prepilin-type N-terminal cleavage/methylation domain-containing protein
MSSKKDKGFTLIELMIVIAICAVLLGGVLVPLLGGTINPNVTIGINGAMETRCQDGYQYTIDSRGIGHQVIGENGGGVKCL